MNDVIFLLCSERSGSNLISRMFGAHRDLCAPGPAHLLRVFGENAHRYEDSEASWQDFSADLQDLFEAKVSTWAIDKNLGRRLSDLSDATNMARRLIDVYAAEAALCGSTGLFIKENQLYAFLPFVLTAVDRARFVYMVRDPRDMVLSWLRSPLARGGIVRAANMWAKDQDNYLKALAWLKPHYLTVALSYEELLGAPDATLAHACEKLELEYDAAMTKFHTSRGAIDNARGSVDWNNTSKPVMTANTGKFRKALDTDQIAYIEQICGSLMEVLGYVRETDSDAPFGSFSSFEDLKQSMIDTEPWDKPGFANVPDEEKRQRHKWAKVRDRIVQQPITSGRDATCD